LKSASAVVRSSDAKLDGGAAVRLNVSCTRSSVGFDASTVAPAVGNGAEPSESTSGSSDAVLVERRVVGFDTTLLRILSTGFVIGRCSATSRSGPKWSAFVASGT